MLRYNETYGRILSYERSIRDAEKEVVRAGNETQKEYAEHLKRLLAAYIIEHRKAARREQEYAER